MRPSNTYRQSKTRQGYFIYVPEPRRQVMEVCVNYLPEPPKQAIQVYLEYLLPDTTKKPRAQKPSRKILWEP